MPLLLLQPLKSYPHQTHKANNGAYRSRGRRAVFNNKCYLLYIMCSYCPYIYMCVCVKTWRSPIRVEGTRKINEWNVFLFFIVCGECARDKYYIIFKSRSNSTVYLLFIFYLYRSSVRLTRNYFFFLNVLYTYLYGILLLIQTVRYYNIDTIHDEFVYTTYFIRFVYVWYNN